MADRYGHRLTSLEARGLVALELAGLQNCADRVGELRSDRTFLRLRRGPLGGLTRSRWDTAFAALTVVESRYRKWKVAVDEARDILVRLDAPAAGVPGVPGPADHRGARRAADLDRLEQLLRSNGVPLSRDEMLKEDRPPPGSFPREPRFSLTYVKSLIENDLGEARRLVREVADVWDTFLPRLERLTTDVHDCEPLLPAAGDGAERAALAALRGWLDEARTAVETDPLAPRAGRDRGDPVDVAHLDRLEDEVRAVRDRLSAAPGPGGERARLLHERLNLYRRRAARDGHATRPELVALHDEARRLMRTAAGPQDLDGVERAVQAYLREVWRLDGNQR